MGISKSRRLPGAWPSTIATDARGSRPQRRAAAQPAPSQAHNDVAARSPRHARATQRRPWPTNRSTSESGVLRDHAPGRRRRPGPQPIRARTRRALTTPSAHGQCSPLNVVVANTWEHEGRHACSTARRRSRCCSRPGLLDDRGRRYDLYGTGTPSPPDGQGTMRREQRESSRLERRRHPMPSCQANPVPACKTAFLQTLLAASAVLAVVIAWVHPMTTVAVRAQIWINPASSIVSTSNDSSDISPRAQSATSRGR